MSHISFLLIMRKSRGKGPTYVLHQIEILIQTTARLNMQQWMIKHFWHKGHNLVFAPINLSDSSHESPIHVLDAGAGTGTVYTHFY
jgi:hypothetical protein